jgi:putative aminopeptidase FrvX
MPPISILVQETLDLLRTLVREPSVVGVEDAFFRVLRRELDEFPITVKRYNGLLVAQGTRPDLICLTAHVDRHGLLCTGPNEFQYAAFIAGNRGELDGDSISEKLMGLIAVRFRGERVQAHTPYTGAYLGQGMIDEAYVCPRRRNLIFQLQGLDFLQPGTPVSFLNRMKIEGGMFSTQLDNIVMVAAVIQLFRMGFQGTALFSAGEEAGRSWRYIAEWFQRDNLSSDRVLVLDTSPFPEEVLDRQDVVLRRRDAHAMFDSALTEEVEDRCKRLGITYTFKDAYIEETNQTRDRPLSVGRTELGRLMNATLGEVTGTTLQLPTTSYHTAKETASTASFGEVMRLLCDLCEIR